MLMILCLHLEVVLSFVENCLEVFDDVIHLLILLKLLFVLTDQFHNLVFS